MKNENDYQTKTDEHTNFSEFPLAVSLIHCGFKLIALQKNHQNSQKVDFVFSKTNALEKTITNYWSGNLLVEPKSFWNISRELKSRMRSETTYVDR